MAVDYTKVERRANEVLENFGSVNSGAVELVDLAEREGFVVGETELDNGADGMILVNMQANEILGYNTKKIILVNERLDNSFKRFVIAHELGHYFMDDKRNEHDFILAHRDKSIKEDDDTEREMDYFAACLLMPTSRFRAVRDLANELLREKKEDPSDLIPLLAAYFRVPPRSVERRLIEVAE